MASPSIPDSNSLAPSSPTQSESPSPADTKETRLPEETQVSLPPTEAPPPPEETEGPPPAEKTEAPPPDNSDIPPAPTETGNPPPPPQGSTNPTPTAGDSLPAQPTFGPESTEPWDSNINNFIFNELTKADHQGNIVPFAGSVHAFNAMGGLSSSKLLALNHVPLNAGVDGMRGCTSVIVIAKRGIWMSHLWEVPGFLNMEIDPASNRVFKGSETPVSPEEFQHRVLDFLRHGLDTDDPVNPVRFTGLRELTGPTGIFEVPSEILKVIVVTPLFTQDVHFAVIPTSNTIRFPVHVNQIIDEIKSTFPGASPVIKAYAAIPSTDPLHLLEEFRHGKIVVQYDPNHHPLGQLYPRSIVRVWVQGEQVGDDITWNPLPHQLLQRNSPRQDQDPCADTE
ncbi:hypothetical protein BDV95DRAFT_602075 [Massariosphaeria phaeospora]|uniref:Uncharacterized protein n=1 Tax=Massariosphaeria phaeospora TaxID=100035 RepID=A0A7C8IEM2_9PLEO|nr:hypothetical protein BDV95DRAFT_602075 [Massariosphaeria phaeospora]